MLLTSRIRALRTEDSHPDQIVLESNFRVSPIANGIVEGVESSKQTDQWDSLSDKTQPFTIIVRSNNVLRKLFRMIVKNKEGDGKEFRVDAPWDILRKVLNEHTDPTKLRV